jgi:hypothetical protein
MISFIIVDKNGNLNECNVDKLENVYKKCGLRKSEDFKKIMVYNLNNTETTIELWGRVVGRNNTKNPFIFKLDTSIKLYGPAALICIKKDKLESLSINDYNNIQLNEASPVLAQSAGAVTPVVAATPAAATPKQHTQSSTSNVTKIEEALNETDLSEESVSDSELENEEYVYSSEEENNK